jgi:hypothetical protein
MNDETPDYPAVDPYALDANAVAGLLQEIFGSEMTLVASQCAHCGNQAEMGTLRAYIGRRVVHRCSISHEVVIRIVTMPDGRHRVDVRGAAYVQL